MTALLESAWALTVHDLVEHPVDDRVRGALAEPCPICELGAAGPCPACNAAGAVVYDTEEDAGRSAQPSAGKLRSTVLVAGSGQRVVTTLGRV